MPKAKTSLNELLHEIRRIEANREVLTETKIRKIYKSLVKDLNAFLAEYYVKYADKTDGTLTIAKLQEKMKFAKFLEEIENNVNFFTPKVKKEIEDLVDRTYKACYEGMNKAVSEADDVKELVGASKLNVRPEVMKQAVENNISKLTLKPLLEKNRQEIIYDIKQALTIGLMNGDRYDTMANKILEKVDFSYGKAIRVTRTESHRNIEAGFNDCAQEIAKGLEGSDIVYTKTWITMKDERVRPQHRYKTKSGWKTVISGKADHMKMEGVTVEATDNFKLEPGVYAPCPGSSGTARNDCNCRCTLEHKFMKREEFEQIKQR